ncbi:MAG: hypothetical protein HN390_12535 [Anaerolineae bacterium]|jgi:hypothetical protein|nr:hypothetical protein [Anaerolineae bacterium]MBT7192065.1 hypothetical protein [Anaerolineae bacterium]MBT7990141.1 hypothetical protein [Anaerolineae bacterium]
MIALVLVAFIYVLLQRLVQLAVAIPFEALILRLFRWAGFRKSLIVSGLMNLIAFTLYLLLMVSSFIFQNTPPFTFINSLPENSILVFRVITFFIISVFIDAIFLFVTSDNANMETPELIKRFYKLAILSLFINATSILLIYVLPFVLKWAL